MRRSICKPPNKKMLIPDFSAKTMFLESNTSSITQHELSKSINSSNVSFEYNNSDNSFSSRYVNRKNSLSSKDDNDEIFKPTLIIDILIRNKIKQQKPKEAILSVASHKHNSLFMETFDIKSRINFMSDRRKTREIKVKFRDEVFLPNINKSKETSREKNLSDNISLSSNRFITEESGYIKHKNTRHSSKTSEDDKIKNEKIIQTLSLKKTSDKDSKNYKLNINRCSPPKLENFPVIVPVSSLSSKLNKLPPLKKTPISLNGKRVISSLIQNESKVALNLKLSNQQRALLTNK